MLRRGPEPEAGAGDEYRWRWLWLFRGGGRTKKRKPIHSCAARGGGHSSSQQPQREKDLLEFLRRQDRGAGTGEVIDLFVRCGECAVSKEDMPHRRTHCDTDWVVSTDLSVSVMHRSTCNASGTTPLAKL